MEETDKIFIPKNVAPHLTEEWASLAHGNFDEYIRKEALLEWLNEELQNGGPTTLVQHIINKVNSM